MRKLLVLFILAVSLFAFDKSEAELVDTETMDMINGQVVANYYCYKDKLYIVLSDSDREQALPVVWYRDGVLELHVRCDEYNDWQLSSLVESDESGE